MTNSEAIRIINQYDCNFYWTDGEKIPTEDLIEAFYLAVKALEEQEPSVLTLEELQYWKEPVWFEEHVEEPDDKPFVALIGNYDPTNEELSIVDVDVYRRETNHDLKIYNKWWRCWSAKPTEEQRRVVPWTE